MDNELDLHITDDLFIGGGTVPVSGRRFMGDQNLGMSFPEGFVTFGENLSVTRARHANLEPVSSRDLPNHVVTGHALRKFAVTISTLRHHTHALHVPPKPAMRRPRTHIRKINITRGQFHLYPCW